MSAPKGNKFALGNSGGRPSKYDSPEQLEKKCEEYFEQFTEQDADSPNYPTVTGLALFLGFCDRQSLYDYREKQEFSAIIKRALLVVENHYEYRCNFQSPTGAIFALKNMGWKDKNEVDHTSKGEAISLTPMQFVSRDKGK